MLIQLVSGVGEDSCHRNSTNQGLSFKQHAQKAISNAISKQKGMFSKASVVSIADLGCSTGPNTIWEVKFVVDEILKVSSAPTVQVHFSDLPQNDFNTLFKLLPEQGQPYFFTAVPGSFYNKLFPNSSLYFAMSNISLQWLSKVPDVVVNRESPAWNPGRIMVDKFSPPESLEALSQLAHKDLSCFLKKRAEELVCGGILSLTIIGRPSLEEYFESWECNFQAAWEDMVDQGVLTQESLDSYNLPCYYRSMAEAEQTLELCDSFRLLYKKQEKYQSFDPEASDYPEKQTLFLKALTLESLQQHLSDETKVELFYKSLGSIVKIRAYPTTDFAVLVFVLERV